jgi:hypothetical protein
MNILIQQCKIRDAKGVDEAKFGKCLCFEEIESERG